MTKYVICKVLLYFFLAYMVDGSVLVTFMPKQSLLEMNCKINSLGCA